MTDSAAPRPPLLQATGLRFSRNDEPVFGPLDLAVDTGEALLVQGPAETLRALTDEITACKGVKTVKLAITAALLPPLHGKGSHP